MPRKTHYIEVKFEVLSQFNRGEHTAHFLQIFHKLFSPKKERKLK